MGRLEVLGDSGRDVLGEFAQEEGRLGEFAQSDPYGHMDPDAEVGVRLIEDSRIGA